MEQWLMIGVDLAGYEDEKRPWQMTSVDVAHMRGEFCLFFLSPF